MLDSRCIVLLCRGVSLCGVSRDAIWKLAFDRFAAARCSHMIAAVGRKAIGIQARRVQLWTGDTLYTVLPRQSCSYIACLLKGHLTHIATPLHSTAAAATVRSSVRRLRDMADV